MRADGKIRNRRLGKRDTALLIKDIWQEKAAHDAEVMSIKTVMYYAQFACLYFCFKLAFSNAYERLVYFHKRPVQKSNYIIFRF